MLHKTAKPLIFSALETIAFNVYFLLIKVRVLINRFHGDKIQSIFTVLHLMVETQIRN